MNSQAMQKLYERALRCFGMQLEFTKVNGGKCQMQGTQQHSEATWIRGNKLLCEKCKQRAEHARNKEIRRLIGPMMYKASQNQKAYDTAWEATTERLTARQAMNLQIGTEEEAEAGMIIVTQLIT